MKVQAISRVSWLFIAVLIGGAIAWVQANIGQGNLTQTCPQMQLEQLLCQEPVRSGEGKQYPWVRDLTIYPPVLAGFTVQTSKGAVKIQRSLVTFEVLTPAPGQKGWMYKPATCLVAEPYRPMLRNMGGSGVTLPEYLTSMKQVAPWIQYEYAWWREPTWTYAIWLGGCLLLIGIIWPFVLDRLVAAGYAGEAEPEPKQKRESLFKRLFGHDAKSAGTDAGSPAGRKPASAELNADELDRIARMEAGLQGFLQANRPADEDEEDAKPGEAPVMNLETRPLETPTMPEKAEAPRDYGGEFYPTVAHGKPKQN